MQWRKWGVLLICNTVLIAFFLLSGGKYALNKMPEKSAYEQLLKIDGVGEIKAERIAKERTDIKSIKDLDTEHIKYSKYFIIRSWDMRTDVMLVMFGISLLFQLVGVFWFLIYFREKGIEVNVNKYIKF